jgi:hypothetical protein
LTIWHATQSTFAREHPELIHELLLGVAQIAKLEILIIDILVEEFGNGFRKDRQTSGVILDLDRGRNVECFAANLTRRGKYPIIKKPDVSAKSVDLKAFVIEQMFAQIVLGSPNV